MVYLFFVILLATSFKHMSLLVMILTFDFFGIISGTGDLLLK